LLANILQAMLVHPDKNGGNDQAEEAFKRLQNAYEVLFISVVQAWQWHEFGSSNTNLPI
jgi:hypothetical protein